MCGDEGGDRIRYGRVVGKEKEMERGLVRLRGG